MSADLGAPLSDGSILLTPLPARRQRLRSGPRHTNTHVARRARATPPEIRPRFRGSLRKSSFSGASPNLGGLSGGGGDDGGGGGDDGGGGATASGTETWVSTVTADFATTFTPTPRELEISLASEATSALALATTAAVATEVAAKAVVVRAEARAEAVTVVALEVAVMEVAARVVAMAAARAAVKAAAVTAAATVAARAVEKVAATVAEVMVEERVAARAEAMVVAVTEAGTEAVIAPAQRRAVRKAASSATPCQTLGVPPNYIHDVPGAFLTNSVGQFGGGRRVVVSLCSCTYVGATRTRYGVTIFRDIRGPETCSPISLSTEHCTIGVRTRH